MDKGILERQIIEFRPISQILHGSVIEFEVPNNSPYHYVDLKNSRIKIKAKIVKDDGEDTELEEGEEVGPCNLTLQSLFSQVDLMIQGVNTSSTGNYWPYKCYIESIRNRRHGDINLSSEVYVMDTGNGFENTALSGATVNAGFKLRSSYFAGSKSVELVGNLWCDFAKQPKYLLNNVPIKLRLTPSKPEFVLSAKTSSPGYKIKIEEASFQVVMVKLEPAVILGHSDALKEKPIKYAYNDTLMSIQVIPTGEYGRVFENLYSSETPSEIIVGIVDSQAFHGNYSKNPFNFQHMKCTTVDLSFNGHSIYPGPFSRILIKTCI